MTGPLVSVLIPTYNGERFLRAAVRSALEQSYKNIEVVIGDDASTDRTPEILASVAAADPRVRIVRHPDNVGGFENPRVLFDQARGEYVKFLLHDDTLATDCIRVLVRGLEAHPEALMAFSRRNLVGEDGRTLPGGDLAPLQDSAGIVDGRTLGDTCLRSGTNLIGELTTVLLRTSAVTTDVMWHVDGRRLEALGDLSLWLRLLSRGPAFYSPQALSRFRQHGDQSSHDPRTVARAMRDWPRLLDWATRQGFLADPADQRRAYAQVLVAAAARVKAFVDGPAHGPALEAVLLITARLAELDDPGATPTDQPLELRAHGEQSLARLAQELDVRCGPFPVAVAVADRESVAGAVAALREVTAAGLAGRCVLAVDPAELDEVDAVLTPERAAGAHLDVELIPTTAPAALFRTGWLAVARRSDLWHEGRADAVWFLDPARVSSPGGSTVQNR